MHRLPAELLSQIFSRYCDNAYSSENPFSSDNSSSFRKHLFTLAKVCKRWRAIVLSTPQIWSQFRVKLNERNIKRCAAMTRAWLSKSGACLLSLGFNYGYLRTQDIRPMLDAIKPYCDPSIWVSVSLHSLPSCQMQAPSRHYIPSKIGRAHV